MKKPISTLQAWLTVLSVSALMVSNIVSAKQMILPFGITMTCAVIVFPITYILSDVFSEVYGYRWSRVTCYMAFAMNVFMVSVFEIAIATNPPSYWQNQDAFRTVLGSVPRTLVASLLAFVVGDFVNDKVFSKMKEKHGNETKGFGGRAILSSVAGELADSIIFIPVAFIGQMPFKTLAVMMVTQVCLKTAYEIIILPVTILVVKKIKNAEGVEQ